MNIKAMLFTQVRHASTLTSRGLVESERRPGAFFRRQGSHYFFILFNLLFIFQTHFLT